MPHNYNSEYREHRYSSETGKEGIKKFVFNSFVFGNYEGLLSVEGMLLATNTYVRNKLMIERFAVIYR